MVRIERAAGFSTAGSPFRASVLATPTLNQAVVVESAEAAEAKRELDRAIAQMKGVERAFSNLAALIGMTYAEGALEQARASVELRQAEYSRLVGVSR